METTDYVSYELAKALKDVGFNEQCYAKWSVEPDGKPYLVGSSLNIFANPDCKGRDALAPFLWHAQKWLREKWGVAINVIAHDGGAYDYDIVFLPNAVECDYPVDRATFSKTYEEALTEGIASVLELIKKEK